MSRSAFRALVRKDILVHLTDRRAIIVTLLLPLLMASFFGSMFGSSKKRLDTDPPRIKILVADEDASPASKAIVDTLVGDRGLAVRQVGAAAARDAVSQGNVAVAVVFPRGFGEALGRAGADRPVLSLYDDPSRQTEAAIVHGVVTQDVMRALAVRAGGGRDAAPPELPFIAKPEAVTAGGSDYNGYAHSFAGMGVQFVLFGSIEFAVGILNERQRGLWKRLRAAPLSKAVVLGSRAVSGALIALLTMGVLFLFGIAVFHIRIAGSTLGFVLVAASYALMAAALGLLIAALGKTPQATRGVSVFVVLIATMLGGAWVPSFLFPAWLQKLSLAFPTRWGVDGLDAMTWRGLGLGTALRAAGVLLAFATLFGAIAVSRFRWEEA